MPLPREHHYTSEDYWNLPEGHRAELIDGQLYNMAPPSRMHQKLISQFMLVLGQYIRDHRGTCEVYPAPFAVNLDAEDKDWVEPDIYVICDTSKLDEYYVFNKHEAENLVVGAREGVEEDENKRNKTDFVLWFTKSKFEDQELKWDSPWGVGYPGWHIECSGISIKHCGEYLDIHCGGIDNAFPHHTNEIAQSEAYLGHKWCNYWFHVLHLNTTSGKMSKSKGEFLTVSLLEEKGYDPLVYRFFCLQSHYRRSLVFSWEALDNAAAAYKKLVTRVASINDKDGTVNQEGMERFRTEFHDALGNDLNTSLAITVLYNVLKSDLNGSTKCALIQEFDEVLSLGLWSAACRMREEMAQKEKETETVSAEDQFIVDAIAARAAAKKAKNYAEADRIRDELKAQGITLIDTPQGVKWSRD